MAITSYDRKSGDSMSFFQMFEEEKKKYMAGLITDPDELECWKSFEKEVPDEFKNQ